MENQNITKFPRYKRYKDSGVDWIGEIPEHWNVSRFKNLYDEINEKSKDGSEELLSVSHYTGVTRRADRITSNELLTNAETLEDYKKVSVGDLVSNIMLAWNGSLGISMFEGITSPAYAVYRLKEKLRYYEQKYFHYLLRTDLYKSEFKKNSSGIMESRLRLYTDDFYTVYSIVPSALEQTAIAQFLDHKTAQIDRAIAIKEEQIKLLNERKQIMIQEAVTKGLDPTVRMKDSGVEWIGEIPEHWEVKPLKYLFDFKNNKRLPLSALEREKMQGQYPYYGASGIIDYIDKYIFDEKLVLIAEDGANLLSKSTPLAFVAEGKYWVNNHAHIIKPLKGDFSYWTSLLNCVDYTIYISGAAQPKLTRDNLANIILIEPSEKDIEQISLYIDSISSPINTGKKLFQQQIQTLKEYKTTLINEAVTGKIKVN